MSHNVGNSDDKGTNQYLLQGLIYKVEKETLVKYFKSRYVSGQQDWEQAVLDAAAASDDSYTEKNVPKSMKELVDNTVQYLASQPNSGIIGDDRDLKRRINVFGKNKKPTPKANGFLKSFTDELQQKMWIVAGATAILSAIFSGIAEGWGGTRNGIALLLFSLLVIIVVALIDFLKDRQYINQQDLLKEESISVIRGKPFSTRSISVWDVVVGDVILVETGNRVPADCMVIESVGLTVDEPGDDKAYDDALEKSATHDVFLKAGSIIKTGNAKAIVCCVGENSTRGVKDEELDTSTKTNLEKKLGNLQNQILLFSAGSALVVFVQMLVYSFIAGATTKSTSEIFKRLAQAFNYTVVLAIASFPEGLPLTIVLALAFSIGEMYKKDKVLVKDNSAPEIMGKIQEVLVGKSGTITKGEMRVKKFLINNREIQNSRKDTVLHCELSDDTILRIKESILFNTQARIEAGETTYESSGTPTDIAMINFLQDADIPVHLFIQRRHKDPDTKLAELNMSSNQRWSAVAIKDYNDPEFTRIYVKGAPEDVVKMCNMHENNGENYANGDQTNAFVGFGNDEYEEHQELKAVELMAQKGLRCISYAYKTVETQEFKDALDNGSPDKEQAFAQYLQDNFTHGQEDVTYLMTLGLKDDLRESVVSDVDYAKKTAFLTVRMVSNDMKETAEKVALKAGILNKIPGDVGVKGDKDKYQVMSGEDFVNLVGYLEATAIGENAGEAENIYKPQNMNAFREVSQQLVVLYRASAEHKKILVAGLKYVDVDEAALNAEQDQAKKYRMALEMMRSVSVTGEGVNDVEALSKAQVGLAMGSGCSSAKENAQMVLVDNNFSSVIKAVQWGRNIFQNCTKFLQFQLTVNVTLVLTIFIGIFFFSVPPMSAQMLLWINLIMDAFAAIALGTEPPIPAIVKGRPKEQTGLLQQKQVLRQIIGISFWNVIVIVMVFIFGGSAAGLEYGYWDRIDLQNPTNTTACPLPRSKIDASRFFKKVNGTTVKTKKPVFTTDCIAFRKGYAKKIMFTYIFNIFIFSQLFNLINCRKIGAADTNVFERFFHNWIFLAIFFGIAAGQVVLVNVFPELINVVGLTRSEWGACITIGSLVLIIAFILKFTPSKWVEFLDVKAIGVDEDNAEANPLATQIANATTGKLEVAGVNAPQSTPDAGEEIELITADNEAAATGGDDGYDKQ